ncbi:MULTISPECIES: IS5 family transposase [unclassified Neglectibacter]|uniref:IS5 family transposase n=1 Tax=unclassified Neglectibacter TaxID=2632164 RepID=UPI001EF03892|nr:MULTISPECIES: IS5 family transposase [unclassified Neglectibacter]
MLRMYLLQCWFSLSDEGVEDAIYDSYDIRRFMGINFFEQDVPGATTLLHFRHLLEEQGIGKLFFDAINRCLEQAGRMMHGGTIVAATLISAPSSTKNTEKKRDPEMHSAKKGNRWHFGMKCHTGVDAGSGFVHTVKATAANVHNVTVAAGLLREDDEVVYGDSAYLGIEKREEIKNSPQLSAITYRINCRPGRLPKISDNAIDRERYIENRKSSVRCKVEHPCQNCVTMIKRVQNRALIHRISQCGQQIFAADHIGLNRLCKNCHFPNKSAWVSVRTR